jgi:hypothetical protein
MRSNASLTRVKAPAPRGRQITDVNTPLASAPHEVLTTTARASTNAPSHFASERLAREFATVGAMIRIYCRSHRSGASGLCADCQQLLDYAAVRLDRCRFGAEKPTCVNCPVHCYQSVRREQMRAVMRFAGPRMLWRHPVLAARHWLDGFRPAPACGGDAA